MQTRTHGANAIGLSLQRRRFLRSLLSGAGGVALASPLMTWDARGAKPLYPTAALFEKALAELEAADDKMFPINHDEGRWLGMLARLSQAKNVLEVGTAHGYWTAWLMLALEAVAGRITTIEIKPERLQKAKTHLARLGLVRRITFLEGNAHEAVPALKGVFDLVFLNADKSDLMDYFRKLHPKKLKPGGLLVVYNAILRRDDMKAFMDAVRAHPDFDAVTVSVTLEDGFFLGARRGK